MMENMELWKKVSTPPPETLKVIGAGRLKGMTDIKPQWRYQIMTQVYGMCGIGWKFNIVKKWSEQGSDNQIFAFADIELFIKVGGEWSDPIPGTGGSMLVTKEKAGLHSSDEGYKMAITDALSTAMKVIGVASEIYMGNWNGSKYKDDIKEPERQPDTNKKFLSKMKELAIQNREAYWEVMNRWEMTQASQITNTEAQQKIVAEIVGKIGKAA